MTEPVKAVRRYDATRRQEQARENRARVLAAAGGLFTQKGYAETSMPEIAQAAGVSVQMVYKVFSNKATLLKAVFDLSVAGDDDEAPMAERNLIGAIQAEPDAIRKIRMYTEHLGEIAHRNVPIQLLARSAAGADPGAAQVWAQMRQETLTAMSYFAADLLATGQVRSGLTAEDVRDIAWTYHSAEIYDLVVIERGWSAERYGRFIGDAMISAMIGAD